MDEQSIQNEVILGVDIHLRSSFRPKLFPGSWLGTLQCAEGNAEVIPDERIGPPTEIGMQILASSKKHQQRLNSIFFVESGAAGATDGAFDLQFAGDVGCKSTAQ